MSSSALAEETAGAGSTDTASTPLLQEEEMITLVSSDGEEFEVSVAVAQQQSVTLRHAIEDGCVAGGVPLPNVSSRTLSTVLEFMNARYRGGGGGGDGDGDDDGGEPAELEKFDEAEFMGKLEMAALLEVVLAANYLDAEALLGAACQRVADMIKDMTPEEVREVFGIENDYTPEEEAEVRKENEWAFL